jgi:hypothetical protein
MMLRAQQWLQNILGWMGWLPRQLTAQHIQKMLPPQQQQQVRGHHSSDPLSGGDTSNILGLYQFSWSGRQHCGHF